ncbi:crtp1 [Symbiodinium natans]|uniref:Crtp1 protein n=1 Tax=Symbiodinium natans TaxID=878477 RepID=A0A812LE93_9DINO|nr:crtp1 [Symbiodinium natans]
MMLATFISVLSVLAVDGVRHDADMLAEEHQESLTGICPSGAKETTGRWVENGWYMLDGFYYRYKNCETCRQAPGDWKTCGTQGSDRGKYTYGDGGRCKSKNGCRCTETRQSGKATTGFKMTTSCESHTSKAWQKCCDNKYSKCVAMAQTLQCP